MQHNYKTVIIKKLNMKTIEVVAAVIFDEQGRIFATQRGYGEWKDWWEFPGGKIEAGETPQQALKREIREELDAEVEIGPQTIAPFITPLSRIILVSFLVSIS